MYLCGWDLNSSPKLGEVAARRADGGVCPNVRPALFRHTPQSPAGAGDSSLNLGEQPVTSSSLARIPLAGRAARVPQVQ